MSRQLRKQFDVLVVGGGPAGLAAAVVAAECGCHVGIVDDNPNLGGQIWRRETTNSTSEDHATFSGVTISSMILFAVIYLIDAAFAIASSIPPTM